MRCALKHSLHHARLLIERIGINWLMGPCLDTLSNARNQPLGVRAFCDDPSQVSEYGVACLKVSDLFPLRQQSLTCYRATNLQDS